MKQYYTQESGSYDSEVEHVVAGVEFGSADIAHGNQVDFFMARCKYVYVIVV